MIMLLTLFGNFYIHAYATRKRATAQKDKDANQNKVLANGNSGYTNGVPHTANNGISNGISNGTANGNKSDKKIK